LRLADQLKFRLDTHTLEFSGLCEACQASATSSNGAGWAPARRSTPQLAGTRDRR
jgi:hypothetical protein